jgi:hypothetical protein
VTCKHERVAIGGNFYVIGVCLDCGEYALAQGTEARRAETGNTGSVHDGPVAKPCAHD